MGAVDASTDGLGLGVKGHQHSQTSQRTLDVLRLLAASKDGLSLAAVARALQVPKGSLYPILCTMHTAGFIDRDQSSPLFLVPENSRAVEELLGADGHRRRVQRGEYVLR